VIKRAGRSIDGGLEATKGYRPKPGERTLEGFMNKNININKEIPLHTKSPGFNINSKGVGGQFKRFGSNSHGGIKPHVHQTTRNVAPNGNICKLVIETLDFYDVAL